MSALDPAEYEVLECILRGMSRHEIASRLKITKAQYEGLRRSLFKKLNAKTTADAVRIAIQGEIDRLE